MVHSASDRLSRIGVTTPCPSLSNRSPIWAARHSTPSKPFIASCFLAATFWPVAFFVSFQIVASEVFRLRLGRVKGIP